MSQLINDFIKKEELQFIEFLSNFQIIGLTIASILGLGISSISKTFIDEIIMPIIESLFAINNWKKFRFTVFKINLGVGLFFSELLNLFFIALFMFIIYSIFDSNFKFIIENKSLWKNELNEYQKKNYKEIIKLNETMSCIKNMLEEKYNKKNKNKKNKNNENINNKNINSNDFNNKILDNHMFLI